MENKELLGFSLAYLDNRISPFRYLVSEHTLGVLNQIALSEKILGVTDTFSLSFLAMLTHLCQPTRFLQLGTHFGYTALVLADIMKHNFRPGHLYTVELNQESQNYARQQAEVAGLIDIIDFIDGSSTDKEVIDTVKKSAPYDIVYIDSSHAYSETIKELEYYIDDKSVITPNSFVLLHDASRFARQYDPTKSGGVNKALEEWYAKNQQYYQLLILEPPIWPNACGLALITGRSGNFDWNVNILKPHKQETFLAKVKKLVK